VAGFTAHRFADDFTVLYTEFLDYNRNVKFYLASHKNGKVRGVHSTGVFAGCLTKNLLLGFRGPQFQLNL